MKEGLTPIRQQYLKIKREYPQAIVFFRLGDFYETFDDDARVVSRELEIVLTSREMGKGNKIPLAGIPYHALDNYLARLIKRGFKVAICEQVTKPGDTKGLVQREVVRLVTPGTVVEPVLLDSKANNYLVSLVLGEELAGLAYVDITTGEFATTQFSLQRLPTELERLRPSEIIVANSAELLDLPIDAPVTRLEDYWFGLEIAQKTACDHFRVATLDGYGCGRLYLATRAAGAIIHYLEETQKGAVGQITHLSSYSTDSFMALDEQTQRNLDIFGDSYLGANSNSLLSIIDITKTAMGGRLLRRMLGQPLVDIKELIKRQNVIDWFAKNTLVRHQVVSLLGRIADLERLINRVKGGIATPRELVALRRGLEVVPELRECFDNDDTIRIMSKNAKQFLANLEQQERERTGIKSLKVGYNKVFGYYIEVSKANLGQVPEEYIRKQTLVGGERFFTPELKEYESLILNAQERIAELESTLFRQVCFQVGMASEQILALASAIANVDVFSSLAEVAVRYSYVRPELTTGNEIVISEGRHPVVERSLLDASFVPNDIRLSNDDAQLIILTGPNMSGKSTYLRQVALIVLLAQVGSFVPATSATIGLVDRIFTRIGAREDITAGQSTFMVEMVETANILNNATPRSLIILDEIGRGTSTYDGLSIAQAVAEYIHNHPGLGAKTVFATHYHELVELASFLPRVKNFNVAVSEEGSEVTFLYKIVPGGVDKSYGIHVAKLAGLPKTVVHRAQEVLEELEGGNRGVAAKLPSKRHRKEKVVQQLSFFGEKSAVTEELEKLDIESLSPLEALTRLYELQKKAREE